MKLSNTSSTHPYQKIIILDTLIAPLNIIMQNKMRLWIAPLCGIILLFALLTSCIVITILFLLITSVFSKSIDLLSFISAPSSQFPITDNIGAIGIFFVIFFLLFSSIAGFLAITIATGSIYAMYAQLILDVHDNKLFSWPTVSHAMYRGFSYTSAFLMRAIVLFLGFCLLIIPALLLQTRLSLFKFFLVEKKYSAIDSLIASFSYTKGNTLRLLLLDLLYISFFLTIMISIYVLLSFLPHSIYKILSLILYYTFSSFNLAYTELLGAHIYRIVTTNDVLTP